MADDFQANSVTKRWSSVSGGWGVPLVYALHSPSQLYDRWGRLTGRRSGTTRRPASSSAAWPTASTLKELSKLCGERDEPAVTVSHDGLERTGTSTGPRRLPVLSPADVRGLTQWQALVI